MLAAAYQSGEFTPLGFAQFDMVAYVHPRASSQIATPRRIRLWNQLFGACPRRLPRSPTSKRQYLAFIHAYTRIFRQPPAEADMQRHFQVSPPSVHQMVLTLERAGLIRRTPGVARSVEILVEPEDLPVLR